MVKTNACYFTLSRAFQDGERFWRLLWARARRLARFPANLPTSQSLVCQRSSRRLPERSASEAGGVESNIQQRLTCAHTSA